jgi:hypothetical protein
MKGLRAVAGKDWLEELRERSETAQRLAAEVPPVLDRDDLSLEDSTDLFQLLTRFASAMEEMIYAMHREKAQENELQMAEGIGSIFDELAAAAAHRMIEIRRRQ